MDEQTKAKAYIENWFVENGFEIREKTEQPKRTKLVVEKDGIRNLVVLPQKINDGPSYALLLLQSFNMYAVLQGKVQFPTPYYCTSSHEL